MAADRRGAKPGRAGLSHHVLKRPPQVSLGHPDPAVRRRSLDILEKALALADFLGIRIIQLAGYDVYYEKGDAQTRALFQENLARCADMAARYGVLMGFETMETPFMDTVGKAMGFVAAINSPYLGVYPDLGNLTNAAVKYQGDLYADLGCGRGHLLAMHLKETRPGQYRDMEFGSGHVDFPQGVETAAPWASTSSSPNSGTTAGPTGRTAWPLFGHSFAGKPAFERRAPPMEPPYNGTF